jgi:hypothetical protein
LRRWRCRNVCPYIRMPLRLVVEKTEAYRWPRTLCLHGRKEGEGGGVRAEGKTTRNLCRSGTTLGRVSPCHGPHARPVSARIRGSLGLFSRARASFAYGRQVNRAERESRTACVPIADTDETVPPVVSSSFDQRIHM